METCNECGNPIDEAGFTNCNTPTKPGDPACKHDRAAFAAAVDAIKAGMSLPSIALMESNGMPERYRPKRADIVALAGLLMEALRQNELLANHLKQMRQHVGEKLH